jgi:hypothetical protein
MLPRRKTLVLFICFFLIAFKVAASSIFIQTAIEQAQIDSSYANVPISQQSHESARAFADKHQVHTMHLMSHVTGNISEAGITIFSPSKIPIQFVVANEVLFSQNFPDSAFKPPKS